MNIFVLLLPPPPLVVVVGDGGVFFFSHLKNHAVLGECCCYSWQHAVNGFYGSYCTNTTLMTRHPRQSFETPPSRSYATSFSYKQTIWILATNSTRTNERTNERTHSRQTQDWLFTDSSPPAVSFFQQQSIVDHSSLVFLQCLFQFLFKYTIYFLFLNTSTPLPLYLPFIGDGIMIKAKEQ